jgi:hypothetical protein
MEMVCKLKEWKKNECGEIINTLRGVLTYDLIDEIITKDDIKNFISEEIIRYVEKHPEKPWNWYEMSMSPNITTEFIEKHPEKHWDWHCISKNLFSYGNKEIEKKIKGYLFM